MKINGDTNRKIKIPITLNFGGFKYNLQETENSKITKYSDILPKHGPYDKRGYWITMEHVHIIKNEKEILQYFPELAPITKITAIRKHFQNYVFQHSMADRTFNDEFQKWIDNSPLLRRIIAFCKEYKITLWDIRPLNVGYVLENNQPRFVIVDASSIDGDTFYGEN